MNTRFIIAVLCFTFVVYVNAKRSSRQDQTGAAAASAAGVVGKDLDGVVNQFEKTGDSLLHAGSDLVKNNPLKGLLGNLFGAAAAASSKS